MGGLRKWLWTIPASASLLASAPAFAQDMCAALDRIAAASREPVPFGSLTGAARTGELVPGFEEGQCQVRAGTRVSCYRNLAPQSLELSAMDRTLRDCLRRAPVSSASSLVHVPASALVFVASGLRYRIASHCHHQCRAGLIAYFQVTLDAARTEEE